MCGIVGYIGAKYASPILVDGLSKLEYRGYDSAGVAIYDGKKLKIAKTAGRLSRLDDYLGCKPIEGNVGIGHTRWATHGRPSDENAHPQADCTGKIAAVHNGIVENYMQLKDSLQRSGHRFKSETDTEVIPHLIESHYQGDLVEAVRKAVAAMEGAFAIVVLCEAHPDMLVAVRKDSPLVIGIGQGENYVASDITAVLGYTRSVYVLDDGEIAVITKSSIVIETFDGISVDKEPFEVQWDPVSAEKAGYDDFMLKEIHEQPRAIRDTLTGRIDKITDEIILDDVKLTDEMLRQIDKVFIVAAGTAYHAGFVGKTLIEKLAGLPVETDIGSEFRYRDPMVTSKTLTVIISQSGETADTLAALREAKRRGSRVIGITNVVGSSVAREADDLIYTWAGPEIAVASTKAYVTQLVCMYLLALYLGQRLGRLSMEERSDIVRNLRLLPGKVSSVLSHEATVKELAQKFKQCEDIFFLGRGLDYAVSLEGALKLKEISYIRAEAYAAGELKHGTLALIVDGVSIFALITQQHIYDKMLSNIKEVKARDATVIALCHEGDEEIGKSVDYVIPIPEIPDLLSPVLTVVPLQLFAYYAAKARGCDVDKPRNLAKSVTVE